jgi:hypothetical protein
MAEGSDDTGTVKAAAAEPPTVESLEAEIARIRERLSTAVARLDLESRALLDLQTPAPAVPPGGPDAAYVVAAGLRGIGQLRAMVRSGTAARLGIAVAAVGVTALLVRSVLGRRSRRRSSRRTARRASQAFPSHQ